MLACRVSWWKANSIGGRTWPTCSGRAVDSGGDRNRRMRKTARFWDFIAKRYARQPVADEASYRKKLEMARTYFSPGSEVLEFGCGTGSTAIAHAPHVAHIRATDVSGKMLAIPLSSWISPRRSPERWTTTASWEAGWGSLVGTGQGLGNREIA